MQLAESVQTESQPAVYSPMTLMQTDVNVLITTVRSPLNKLRSLCFHKKRERCAQCLRNSPTSIHPTRFAQFPFDLTDDRFPICSLCTLHTKPYKQNLVIVNVIVFLFNCIIYFSLYYMHSSGFVCIIYTKKCFIQLDLNTLRTTYNSKICKYERRAKVIETLLNKCF